MQREEKGNGISIEAYNMKMDFLEVKMEQIERKISNKADEIVTIQLLQHRRELEELYSAVEKIESHLKLIDCELSNLVENTHTRRQETRVASRSAQVAPLFT